MNETYCGKSCDSCDYKISEQCPGCGEGPGHKEYGACDLAKCCRDKGHEKCDTCKFNSDCYLLKDKEYMPEEMAKKTKMELDRREKMSTIGPMLAFWINMLLWTNVPNFIGSLMSDGIASGVPTEIAAIGNLISLAAQLAYVLILFKISVADKKYMYGGVAMGISLGLSVVVICMTFYLPINNQKVLLAISGVSLVAAVVSVVGAYYEIVAHAGVLRGVDNILSQKWIKLWNWTLIMMLLMVGGLFLSVIMAGLASLMVLASTIIAFVVGILKLKYLYDTSKAFQNQISALEG